MEVIRYLCESFYLIVKIQHMTVCVGTLKSEGTITELMITMKEDTVPGA